MQTASFPIIDTPTSIKSTYNAPVMNTHLEMGAFYHPLHLQLSLSGGEGTHSCGEDAYFISKRKNMMGISDGVSAWSAYGLGNSGYLAFYLMSNARVAAEKREILDTEKLINDSFEAVWDLHDNKLVTIPNGSATITTLRLDQDTSKQSYIHYSNLGDCMVMVIRPEKVDDNTINPRIIHTSRKLYSFHEHARGVPVPLQLVFYPAQGRKLSTEQSGGVETCSLPVQEDDIIILATDGLWDNLMNDDVVRVVMSIYGTKRDSQGVRIQPNPSEIAKRLVEEAVRMNLKPDDITCIVAFVNKNL